jgi:hypothetical protein
MLVLRQFALPLAPVHCGLGYRGLALDTGGRLRSPSRGALGVGRGGRRLRPRVGGSPSGALPEQLRHARPPWTHLPDSGDLRGRRPAGLAGDHGDTEELTRRAGGGPGMERSPPFVHVDAEEGDDRRWHGRRRCCARSVEVPVTAGSAPSAARWRASTTRRISTRIPIATAQSDAAGADGPTSTARACSR